MVDDRVKDTFSKYDKETIRRFANSITPKNWVVCLNWSECVVKKNHLNVILDLEVWNPSVDDLGYHGLAKAPWYWNGVGYSPVYLQPFKNRRWKPLLLHEMAHVLVFRWIAIKSRMHQFARASFCSREQIIVCSYLPDRVEVIENGAAREMTAEVVTLDGNCKKVSKYPHGQAFKTALKFMNCRAERMGVIV